MGFIDTMRGEGFAVETICQVLREQGVAVTARTYRAWKTPKRVLAARTVGDAAVVDAMIEVRTTADGRPTVRTWAGFVYVAFVVDVFAQRIVGWHAMTSKPAELVLIPLRMGAWSRGQQGHPLTRGDLIAHSDAGSPSTRR
jgi:transposase InsO family protein